jgi:16S rRNA (cytosine967-C5)-methyltransferase
MTCSVFKKENEDVVTALLKELPLELAEMRVITGYQHKADSMFVARLLKK